MTSEEKIELFIALCTYYPHGVICHVTDMNDPEYSHDGRLVAIKPSPFDGNGLPYLFEIEGCSVLIDITEIKPYLRPGWSLTEEETAKFASIRNTANCPSFADVVKTINTLYSQLYDCGGLIRKGLAHIAKEGMYNGKSITPDSKSLPPQENVSEYPLYNEVEKYLDINHIKCVNGISLFDFARHIADWQKQKDDRY